MVYFPEDERPDWFDQPDGQIRIMDQDPESEEFEGEETDGSESVNGGPETTQTDWTVTPGSTGSFADWLQVNSDAVQVAAVILGLVLWQSGG